MISVAREIAFKALLQWAKSKADPHVILAGLLSEDVKPEDAAFSRELFFGTLKYKRKVDFYSSPYYASKNLEYRLKQIIRLSFYQLLQTQNIPAYAVVSESVELAKKFSGPGQARFVNAVLRNYLRDPEKIVLPDFESDPVKYLGITLSFPDWLVAKYIKRFGLVETGKLLSWFNQPPKLCFFINDSISQSSDIRSGLKSQDLECEPHEYFTDYFECGNSQRLLKSDIFKNGYIIIGDPAQGLPAKALGANQGDIILDLFAAPGGKSAALAGIVGREGLVIACDSSIQRLRLMKKNVSRWKLENVILIQTDTLKFASRRNLRYILADVPCSGTGSMRRNPDLRWRLKAEDIKRQAKRQLMLLEAASYLLEPGGRLVYSTCSIEPEENEQIVGEFLKQNVDYGLKNVDLLKNLEIMPGMYGVMPHKHKADGSFVAVIERRI